MIPKNLIQILLGNDTTSEYLLHLSKKWQLDYPDWNHKVYRDADVEELVKQYSDLAWEMYSECPVLSYRADIARLIVLYYVGGIYLDIDTRPRESLADHLTNLDQAKWGFFILPVNEGGHLRLITNNHLAIAEKESEMIKGMIDNIIEKYIELKSKTNEVGWDSAWESGFKFASLVSTDAWGEMVYDKLVSVSSPQKVNSLILGLPQKLHWITWDGNNIHVSGQADWFAHIGGGFIKDFIDINVLTDPLDKVSELYKGLSIQNGEIKIISRGL